MGKYDVTVDTLPGGDWRRALPPPVQTGVKGGVDLNLHTLADKGVRLLGRLSRVDRGVLEFDDELREVLERGDRLSLRVKTSVDDFIADTRLDAGSDDWPEYHAGYLWTGENRIRRLDLVQSDIQTIIWATGYVLDYSWINLPVFDEQGAPLHERGVVAMPGLYFVGLDWLYKVKSSILSGIGEDSQHIVEHIKARL